MLALALDVGTSSARAACYGEDGAPVPGAEGRVTYEPHLTPAGAAELDADALVAAVTETIDRCLAGAGSRAAEIGAVGASVFWHSLLGVDAAGRALTPVITWADTRSAGAARELARALDVEAVRARTGAPLHSAFWPAKLRWLHRERPDVVRRVRRWCGFAEYLSLAFTGQLRASLSMASATGLLDQARCQWDPDVLSACEVDAGSLPAIDEAPRSGLAPGPAARWPALARVPWCPAWGDGACSNLGSGCAGPDRIALNLGTSAAVRLVTTEPLSAPPGLWAYRVDRRRRLLGGATSEGGNVLAWCRRWLALPHGDGALDLALGALETDGHGLTALPLLAGERSPGWQGAARGAVTGLSLASSAIDLARALLEGVACRLAMVYERLAPLATPGHAVIASGGALEHVPSWAGMIADALGVPIEVAAESEASSRGAALLALEAAGGRADAVLPRGRPVAPDPARHQRYRAARARQERLYESVVPPAGS